LYLATRSERQGAPVLIWPEFTATARSAMVVSSVSPERWEITVAHPARWAISTASRVSVRVPIWLSLIRMALAARSWMPRARNLGLVTKTSSPTSWTRSPIARVRALQPAQSSSAMPSSSEKMGYLEVHSLQSSIIPSESRVLPSPSRRYFPSL